jgi:O-antigen biosynthesis protein WbqP
MRYIIFKRFVDIILASVLLIFLFPLFILISFIIYIQDKGPALFKQKRIGKDGVEFDFYKFRSMPVDTPLVQSSETCKINITRFGRFIRRTNLDELPQFYNVLKGDMSFIGPRPPIPSQLDLIEYRKINGSLKLRPGLTGLAQINSFNGMTPKQKSEYDGEYVNNLTFKTDLFILIKTVKYFSKTPPTY